MTLGGITEAFAKVIDMKDRYTNGHSSRVAKYTAMLVLAPGGKSHFGLSRNRQMRIN